jgi:hypothetical protein
MVLELNALSPISPQSVVLQGFYPQMVEAFPHQFALNYQLYEENMDKLPVDPYEPLALAPRPVLLGTGSEEHRSNPNGEFLATAAAEPVFRPLGADGLGTHEIPALDQAHFSPYRVSLPQWQAPNYPLRVGRIPKVPICTFGRSQPRLQIFPRG